ncbi:MAG TPA: ABC transporter ATP-binding protein [Parvularcula sp.]|nr:ABC transporter ATP-binding protein [Parvularcula sp.]
MTLSLRDIRFGYGRDLVLDGLSLAAEKGEIVCLFGPSGCGKSTALRVAAGLERIGEGAVVLDGAVLSSREKHTPPEKRGIGLVFQDFVLFQHMSVAENVAFGLDALSRDEKRARVDAELAAVGLSALAQRRPAQLSGGQQQRVALARAFARRPKALLLDEPFASIDASLRRRLRADLRRMLKERGNPAIVVTHDSDEAVELGDRIAIMRRGRIIEDAAPETLWRAPQTAEGALLFVGAQSVDAAASGAFGIEAPAVILAGGARAEATADGAARVLDCRFAGPFWQATLEAVGHPGVFLRAEAPGPLAPGTRASLIIDPTRLRRFPRAASTD